MFKIDIKQYLPWAAVVALVGGIMLRNTFQNRALEANAILFDRFVNGDETVLEKMTGIYKDMANLASGLLTKDNPELKNAEFRLHPLTPQVLAIHKNKIPETDFNKHMAPNLGQVFQDPKSKPLGTSHHCNACKVGSASSEEIRQAIEDNRCTTVADEVY